MPPETIQQVHARLNVHIAPMLACEGAMPADPANWAFEYKWDGIRALCYWDGESTRLESRNLRNISWQYPDLLATRKEMGAGAMILDGEIIALDRAGRPSFALLQQRMHLSPRKAAERALTLPVQYYIFDLLWHRGRSLMHLPYLRRRRALEKLKLLHPAWRLPPSHVGKGPAMLEVAASRHLEGLIAKRPGSIYQPGKRSSDWIKIKLVSEQEFVIGGWEPRQENAEQVAALLLGFYPPGSRRLQFAGRVGTGFNSQTHRMLVEKLRRMPRSTSPFVGRPGSRSARYVSPRLVAQVAYRRWPAGAQLQQASFLGLRDDKDPREVVIEDR
jgi:bifunctional non-homologous end joining protein LigD